MVYLSVCAPLITYLDGQAVDVVVLRVEEIETILDIALPPSAHRRYWYWRAPQSAIPRELRAAGWEVRLSLPRPAVVFRRLLPETREG